MRNTWLITNFTVGLSEGSKKGIDGSFRAGQGLDYRTDPDILTALKKLKKDSGTTITDMPKWMVTENGNLWVYGDTGKLYKRNSSGTWSLMRTVSNSSGNGLAVFDDYLYYAYDKGFGRYGPLSGTPSFDDDFLVSPQYENDHSYDPTPTKSYTIPTSVSETSTNKYSWTAGTDTLTGVVVNIDT